MANAFHYVKDKPAFIEKIKKHLKPSGQMIIVEYDTVRQNRWVPYPISFENLIQTFSSSRIYLHKKDRRKKLSLPIRKNVRCNY